jgi:hypothetical protein
MHAVIRSTSGTKSLHSLIASSVQSSATLGSCACANGCGTPPATTSINDGIKKAAARSGTIFMQGDPTEPRTRYQFGQGKLKCVEEIEASLARPDFIG